MEHNNKLYLTSNEAVLFDEYYRYKISIIQMSAMIKKGTPITVLDNFGQFCEELVFQPTTLINILGKSLSCKSGVDKSGKYYLQGTYTVHAVKEVLYNFIQHYLLCVNCDKPEVTLKHKNSKIKQKCHACGNNTYLTNCKDEVVAILAKSK